MLIDVDECESAAGRCSNAGQCINTDGAYRCICSAGFHVTADSRDCQGLSCPVLSTRITRETQVIPGIRTATFYQHQKIEISGYARNKSNLA